MVPTKPVWPSPATISAWAGANATMRDALPTTPEEVARIWVIPGPTAVANPFWSISTTVGEELAQVMESPVTTPPVSSTPCAESGAEESTASAKAEGVITT